VTGTEISKEIGELNLAYMLLSQRLLKQDRAAAMFRLGISRELADLLIGMSVTQTVKLAATNMSLCSFRLGEQPSIAALAREVGGSALQNAHMAILMAGRQLEARA
jgi:flagellar transcriptional activator FlhD